MSSCATKKPSKQTTRRLHANLSFLSNEPSNQAVYSYDLFHVSKDPVTARRLVPPVINYDSASDLPKMVRLQQKLSATETSYDKSFSFIPENMSIHSLAIVPAAKTVHLQKVYRNLAAPDEVVTLDTSRSIILQEDTTESLVLPAIGTSQNCLHASNKRNGRSPSLSKASRANKPQNTTTTRSFTAHWPRSDSMHLDLPLSHQRTSQNNVFISDSPQAASLSSASLLHAATTDDPQDYGRMCHAAGYDSDGGTQSSSVNSSRAKTRTPTATATTSHEVNNTDTPTSTSTSTPTSTPAYIHTSAATAAPTSTSTLATAATLSADNLLSDPEVQALLRISARFEQAYERNNISRYGSRAQSGRATAVPYGGESGRATAVMEGRGSGHRPGSVEGRRSGHEMAGTNARPSAHTTLLPDGERSRHAAGTMDTVGTRSGNMYTPAHSNGGLPRTNVDEYARTSTDGHNGMPTASAISPRDHVSARASARASGRGGALHDSAVDGHGHSRTAYSVTDTVTYPSAPPSRGLPVLTDPPALGFPEPQFTLTSSLEQVTRAMRAEEATSPWRHGRDRTRAREGEITCADIRTGTGNTNTRTNTRGDTRTCVQSGISTNTSARHVRRPGPGYGYASNTDYGGVYDDAIPTHAHISYPRANVNAHAQTRATVASRMGRGRTARATAYPVAAGQHAAETAPSVAALATTATSDNAGKETGMGVGMGVGVGTLGLALVRSPYNLGATVAFAKRSKHNCEAERLSRVDRECRGDEYWVQRSNEGRDMVRSVHGRDRHVRGFSCKGYGKGQRGFLRKGEGVRTNSGRGESIGNGGRVGRQTIDGEGRIAEDSENDVVTTAAAGGAHANDDVVEGAEDGAGGAAGEEAEELLVERDAGGGEEEGGGVDCVSAGTSASDPASKPVFSSKTSTSGLRKLVQELLEQLQGLKEEEDAERRAVAYEEKRWEERVREEERARREKKRIVDAASDARVAMTRERQRQEREAREKEYEEQRTIALARAREAVEKRSKDMRALTSNVDAVVARGEEILTTRVERLREAIAAADEKQGVRAATTGQERRKAEVEEERYVLVCEIRRLRVEVQQRMKVLRVARGEKERLRRLVESPRKEEREKERRRAREERMQREKERTRRAGEREERTREEENTMISTTMIAVTGNPSGNCDAGEDTYEDAYAEAPNDNIDTDNNNNDSNDNVIEDVYASDRSHNSDRSGGSDYASANTDMRASIAVTTPTAPTIAIDGDGGECGHAPGDDSDEGECVGYDDDYTDEYDGNNDNSDCNNTDPGSGAGSGEDPGVSVGVGPAGVEILASKIPTSNENSGGEEALATPYNNEDDDNVIAGNLSGSKYHFASSAGDAHGKPGNQAGDDGGGTSIDAISNTYDDDDYEDSFELSRVTAPTATATHPIVAVAPTTPPAALATIAEATTAAVAVDQSCSAEFEASVHVRAGNEVANGAERMNVDVAPYQNNNTTSHENSHDNDNNNDYDFNDGNTMGVSTGIKNGTDNTTNNNASDNDYNADGYNQDFSLPEDDNTPFANMHLPVDVPGSMQRLQGRVSLTHNAHSMNLTFTRESGAESFAGYSDVSDPEDAHIGVVGGGDDDRHDIGLGIGLDLPEGDEYALDGYADEFED